MAVDYSIPKEEYRALLAENDKLRELVADMHRDICIAYLRGRPLDPYQYESRMRELGVEASG